MSLTPFCELVRFSGSPSAICQEIVALKFNGERIRLIDLNTPEPFRAKCLMEMYLWFAGRAPAAGIVGLK